MTEKNLVAQLQDIESNGNNNNGKKFIYFGGPWFNNVQADMYKRAYEAILKNETVAFSHVPVLNQSGGISPFEGDEVDMEWARLTFKADVTAMDNADVMIALYDANNVDEGTIFEHGYMYASHKPVVFVTQGDLRENPVNLMPAMAATSWISVDDLADFNFEAIVPSEYKGGVI